MLICRIIMTKENLAKEIFKASYLTGTFVLRSGAVSNEYFDKYQFESQPGLLNEITNHLMNIIPDDFDILAGLETGGIPIATVLSLKSSKAQVFVRKKAKEYGTKKLAEGININGKKVLVVEDVVTSGGQIIKSVEDLRKEGAIIDTAICIIDREAGGKENLLNAGVQLISLFTMTDLKKFSEV